MEKAFAGLGFSLLFIDGRTAARLQWYLLSIRSTRAAWSVHSGGERTAWDLLPPRARHAGPDDG